jgi:serine/threonine protein kinase
MSETLPREFGPYRLEKFIAEGGMARVYRATRKGDPNAEPIVVKLMRAQISEDAQGPAMFRDEARLAHQLVHPHIVRVFDYGEHGGEHGGELFMAMELIDGPSVSQLLRTYGKPIPPRTALLVAIELCEALDYAHKAKDENGRPLHLVHRDVSPQNVLLSLAGEVKLADFGIAKVAFGREAMTKTNFIKGKIGYMAPEQLLGKALDHRSDQFAAGILLWEMLCGTRLFKEKTDAANIQKVVYGRAERPSVINRDLPGALDEVVLRALEKEPDARYGDMHDFAKALRGALTRFPASPDDGVEHIIAKLTGRPPRSRSAPSQPNSGPVPFAPPRASGASGSSPSSPQSAPWAKAGAQGTPSAVPVLAIGAPDIADEPTQHRDGAPGSSPGSTPSTPSTVRGGMLGQTPGSGLRKPPSTGSQTARVGSGMTQLRSGETQMGTGETSMATSLAPQARPARGGIPVWTLIVVVFAAGAAFAGGIVVGQGNQPDPCGTLTSDPKKIDLAYDKAVEAQRMLEGGNTFDAIERAKASLAFSATGRAHFVLARAALTEFRNKEAFFHLMCTARLDPDGDEMRWAVDRIKRRD